MLCVCKHIINYSVQCYETFFSSLAFGRSFSHFCVERFGSTIRIFLRMQKSYFTHKVIIIATTTACKGDGSLDAALLWAASRFSYLFCVRRTDNSLINCESSHCTHIRGSQVLDECRKGVRNVCAYAECDLFLVYILRAYLKFCVSCVQSHVKISLFTRQVIWKWVETAFVVVRVISWVFF